MCPAGSRICLTDNYVCVLPTLTYVSRRHLRMCPADTYVCVPAGDPAKFTPEKFPCFTKAYT